MVLYIIFLLNMSILQDYPANTYLKRCHYLQAIFVCISFTVKVPFFVLNIECEFCLTSCIHITFVVVSCQIQNID